MSLEGKTAVITGASRGIGAEVARMLHERGVNLGQVGLTAALDGELRERGIRCTSVCPGGVATDFALEEGRGRTPEVLPGMMTARDVAEVVVFILERPRRFRILETAFRPMTEASWG